MNFAAVYERQDAAAARARIMGKTAAQVERALAGGDRSLAGFEALLSPAAGNFLETMARQSAARTRARFGATMQLFAPLYLSNECRNLCTYCAFSVDRKLPRKTLTMDEIASEAAVLAAQGFRHLLLVTGEADKVVDVPYFAAALDRLRPHCAQLSLEVQPLERAEYEALRPHGLHGVLVYQETYDRAAYALNHPRGRKADFAWRLAAPERIGAAGVNKIGLGALLGLSDWRLDAWYLALHLDDLERRFWRSRFSVSLPRIRPQAGGFVPGVHVGDREWLQLLCAFRLFNPEIELILSTRESAPFRDGAMRLGVTTMSAGSKTNPGGYATDETSLPQFEISDARCVEAVAAAIRSAGLEPVWKDWEPALDAPPAYAAAPDCVPHARV